MLIHCVCVFDLIPNSFHCQEKNSLLSFHSIIWFDILCFWLANQQYFLNTIIIIIIIRTNLSSILLFIISLWYDFFDKVVCLICGSSFCLVSLYFLSAFVFFLLSIYFCLFTHYLGCVRVLREDIVIFIRYGWMNPLQTDRSTGQEHTKGWHKHDIQ